MFNTPTAYEKGLETRGYAHVNYATGDCPAKFSREKVKNKFKSETEKRIVLEDKIFVHVYLPGGDSIKRVVTEDDKRRWAKQWAAFEAGSEQLLDGTPLDAWPMITQEEAEGWKILKIFSVEQLANVSDTVIQDYGMGGRSQREKAKKFLASEATSAPISELKSENELLKEQIALLQKQMATFAELTEDRAATRKKG